MANIDEKLAKDVSLALRQTEIIRAQIDLLFSHLVDLARQAGVQIIDQSQRPPPEVTSGGPTNDPVKGADLAKAEQTS